MDKKVWGPALWRTIHATAAAYRPENRESYRDFIYSLQDIMPCDYCKKHLRQNLLDLPLENFLVSNRQLFLWTYLLHDLVNQQLNKRSPPFEEVENQYFSQGVCPNCRI